MAEVINMLNSGDMDTDTLTRRLYAVLHSAHPNGADHMREVEFIRPVFQDSGLSKQICSLYPDMVKAERLRDALVSFLRDYCSAFAVPAGRSEDVQDLRGSRLWNLSVLDGWTMDVGAFDERFLDAPAKAEKRRSSGRHLKAKQEARPVLPPEGELSAEEFEAFGLAVARLARSRVA